MFGNALCTVERTTEATKLQAALSILIYIQMMMVCKTFDRSGTSKESNKIQVHDNIP